MKIKFLPPILLIFSAFFSFLIHQDMNRKNKDPDSALFNLAGAFRVFVSDAIWMRMRAHAREGNEAMVLSDARTLLKLDPYSHRVRNFLHFHLTFNMSRKATDRVSKMQWIREGLEIMVEGLKKNPDSFLLNYGLGKTFFHRTDKDPVFKEVCLDLFNKTPVQLAPIYFEIAYKNGKDPSLALYYIFSLLNAAHHETRNQEYKIAEKHWKNVEKLFPLWLTEFETSKESQDFLAYVQDLKLWCAMVQKAEKLGPKGLNELKQRILDNPFCDLDEKVFQLKDKN